MKQGLHLQERCVIAASWCAGPGSEAACRKLLTLRSGEEKDNENIDIKIFSKVCVYSNKFSVFLIFSSKLFLNAKQVTQLGWSYWIERDVGQTQCWQIIYVSKSISSSSHANPSNVTSTKSPSGCTSVVADWPETSSLVHVSSGLVHFRLETSAGHAPTSSHSRMSGAILRCTFSTLAAYGKKSLQTHNFCKKQTYWVHHCRGMLILHTASGEALTCKTHFYIFKIKKKCLIDVWGEKIMIDILQYLMDLIFNETENAVNMGLTIVRQVLELRLCALLFTHWCLCHFCNVWMRICGDFLSLIFIFIHLYLHPVCVPRVHSSFSHHFFSKTFFSRVKKKLPKTAGCCYFLITSNQKYWGVQGLCRGAE